MRSAKASGGVPAMAREAATHYHGQKAGQHAGQAAGEDQMPFMKASDGCSIYYQFDGEDGRPVVMLSNSLGSNMTMWEPQLAALIDHYRVLRYDNRGHGMSDVAPGPYTLDRIGSDARELIAHLNLGAVLWCGLSLGGMVGMWLASNVPGALKRAVLANTSAFFGMSDFWNQRIALAESGGMEAIANAGVVGRWLSADFAAAHPDITQRLTAMNAATPVAGFINTVAAIRDMDLRGALSLITVPALVIAGSRDPATSAAMGEEIASGIVGARFALLEAAHLSNWEQTEEFNSLVRNFFDAA
jgi:3-oxoadipate enol-lactonase